MKKLLLMLMMIVPFAHAMYAGNYKNFKVAVYVMVSEVNRMGDRSQLEKTWTEYTKNLKVDKVYLETFRDMVFVDEKALQTAISFFREKGVEVSGGITYNAGGGNRMRWESFCYSNPVHRKLIKETAELTARYFNEFVLDDYYFTNCKCDLCIEAKGDQSWSGFRTKLLDDAAKDLIVGPAHKINPACRVIVKYPNWYEHFQGLGFDLEHGPYTFDGVYTGTETRNPQGEQHLQPYESYSIVRYFNNLRPGYNFGGWVDTGSMLYFDMFPEQLWMTLLAKAPEITLFNYGSMSRPFREMSRPWENRETSFNLEKMKEESVLRGISSPTWGRVAEYAYEEVDKILGQLGNPKGIKSYKPFHSIGEDFLQNYMGMAGIPVEIVPEFPEDEQLVILTEQAKFDPGILLKMKNHMRAGKDILITSGLFRALQDKGIKDIVEMEYTDRKADVDTILVSTRRSPAVAKTTIKIPQMTYMTNDSWEDISTLDYGNGWPMLQQIAYSKGNMFIWVVPENFSHIYALPDLALNRLRNILSRDVKVHIEGPAQIALFTYDNNTFVVESFLDNPVTITLVTEESKSIMDLKSKQVFSGESTQNEKIYGREGNNITRYQVTIEPHSFRGFKITL
jgi:hypothetical protein